MILSVVKVYTSETLTWHWENPNFQKGNVHLQMVDLFHCHVSFGVFNILSFHYFTWKRWLKSLLQGTNRDPDPPVVVPLKAHHLRCGKWASQFWLDTSSSVISHLSSVIIIMKSWSSSSTSLIGITWNNMCVCVWFWAWEWDGHWAAHKKTLVKYYQSNGSKSIP